MRAAIAEVSAALRTLGRGGPWDADTRGSDDFLTPLFESYFRKLNLPNLMQQKNFYELAKHVPEDGIDPEIREKLDAVACAAEGAKAV